jgi:hypothetical protein
MFESMKNFNLELKKNVHIGDNKYLSRSGVKDNKRRCNSFIEDSNIAQSNPTQNIMSLFGQQNNSSGQKNANVWSNSGLPSDYPSMKKPKVGSAEKEWPKTPLVYNTFQAPLFNSKFSFHLTT